MTRMIRSILQAGLVAMSVSSLLAGENVRVTIQKIEYVKGGVNFYVEIGNLSRGPIFLEELDRGSRDPSGLVIQQWDEQRGWIILGPNREVPPSAVFELAPGEKLSKCLEFTDPYPHPKQVPPVVIPVTGLHRATVPYFLSEDDWRSLMSSLSRRPGRSRKAAVVKPEVAISEPVAMPVASDHEKGNRSAPR